MLYNYYDDKCVRRGENTKCSQCQLAQLCKGGGKGDGE